MSIKVTSWVWENATASGTELLVLLSIADNANDQGEAFGRVSTYAKKSRQTTRNFQIVARKLEAAGQLIIDPPRQGRRTNTFTIPFTEELQAQAKKRAEDIERVKGLSGVGGEKAFRGGVNPDSGSKGEKACTPGVNPDSGNPLFNHPDHPSDEPIIYFTDYDMPWETYAAEQPRNTICLPVIGNQKWTPEKAWDAARHQLVLQLGKNIFDQYLADAQLVDYFIASHTFVLSGRHFLTHEAIMYRFRRLLVRVLSDVSGCAVNLEYVEEQSA